MPILKARAAELGISDRMIFTGRVPYDALPGYINALDICLSTQTNDAVGRVRTTGKLPLYLACGRYVLASDVGEASLVLPVEMRVPFHGSIDAQYPEKLADRVREIVADETYRSCAEQMVAVARERFEKSVLVDRLSGIVGSIENDG